MAVLTHFFEIALKPNHPLYYVFVEWSIEWFLYFVLTLENYMIQKMENYMIQKMENYMIQKNGKLYDSTN